MSHASNSNLSFHTLISLRRCYIQINHESQFLFRKCATRSVSANKHVKFERVQTLRSDFLWRECQGGTHTRDFSQNVKVFSATFFCRSTPLVHSAFAITWNKNLVSRVHIYVVECDAGRIWRGESEKGARSVSQRSLDKRTELVPNVYILSSVDSWHSPLKCRQVRSNKYNIRSLRSGTKRACWEQNRVMIDCCLSFLHVFSASVGFPID